MDPVGDKALERLRGRSASSAQLQRWQLLWWSGPGVRHRSTVRLFQTDWKAGMRARPRPWLSRSNISEYDMDSLHHGPDSGPAERKDTLRHGRSSPLRRWHPPIRSHFPHAGLGGWNTLVIEANGTIVTMRYDQPEMAHFQQHRTAAFEVDASRESAARCHVR